MRYWGVLAVLLAGCSASERGGVPPGDAGVVVELDAATPYDAWTAPDVPPIACIEPGLDCSADTGGCCGSGVCVNASDGIVCADQCRADAECGSGCCAPILDGTAAVCSPADFCTSSTYVEDVCTVLAEVGCGLFDRCDVDAPGCREEIYGTCCGDDGTCGALSRIAPWQLRNCIVSGQAATCDTAGTWPVGCDF